jgi:DNA invertase Pin-like site-specific DNA recombinase
MIMNVAIYARFSSENQRDASISDQVRICRAHAEREGWTVAEVFADHAISGATTDRPAYLELMRRIRARRIHAVVTESLDRISRDQEHLAAFYKLSSFSDVQIITLAEGQVSELHVGIKGMMGSLYLKDLAQKTKRGLAGRILAGRSVGTAPFGYLVIRRLNESGEPERGLREINPAEAIIVRRIFSEYVGGASPMRIAKMLNSEGVRGPTGGIWWDSSIRGHEDRGDGVLRNPTYAGRLVWNRQQNLKDPELGTRRRRANAKDEIITQLAPELVVSHPVV